jgi:hypothetical protein
MSGRGRILKYNEMCQEENLSLQKGMNFCGHSDHSILLMSQRKDAPYKDSVSDNGLTLIYEGHDASRDAGTPNPKMVDQPQFLPSGKLTENGKFFAASRQHKTGLGARSVRVYEKLRDGIWADNGDFKLVDAWQESDGVRLVFKFKLIVIEAEVSQRSTVQTIDRSRIIPSAVKQEVWLRDGGRCTLCEAMDDLHFDHIIPYSKGGSSLVANNIQLLCARHNLEKRDKIE